MNKQKTLKIISASAIAASAFVATTPHTEAATVSQADKLVQTAKSAGTILKWAISIEGTADGKTRPWAAYNNAKTAYNSAVKAVNTLPTAQKNKYMSELDGAVKLHIDRTMRYIDAITAGEKIKEKQQLLAYQLDINAINDNTEKAYHELSTEIRKQAILLDRVYGQSTRDLIRSQYKQAAETVRDKAKYPVTVKIELDLATKELATNNFSKAEKHMEEAKKYLKYVDHAVIKKELNDRLNTIETKLTPKVEKISAAEPKRIKVEFNKGMLTGSGTNGAENTSNYAVSGRSIKSVKLADDKKSVLIELFEPLYTNSTYSVTVKRNIQTADYVTLSKDDYVTSFTFNDNIKPTVTFVTTNANGNLEIKFSELIAGNSPIAITIDGKSVSFTTLYNESDTIVIQKAELDRLGLRKGNWYSIVASGARDLVTYSPNMMNTYSGTFLYNSTADTSAPEVKSIQAKDEKTFTVEFSETLADFNTNHLAITKGNTTIRPSSVKDVSNSSKTKFEVELPASIYGTNETSVWLNVEVKNYKDLSNNIGRTINQSVTLSKDLNQLIYSSITYDVTANEIQITFNKALKSGSPVANKVTVYDSNNKPVNKTLKSNVGNKMIIDARNLNDGYYLIDVAAGAVQDNTVAQNNNVPFSTTITKKVDNTKPWITNLHESNVNGQFKVAFNEPVNTDSAKSATNYLLGGNSLPAGTSLEINDDKKIVTITLPEGTAPSTTKYTITASGVKDLADNDMVPYSNTVTIRDNKKPELMEASLGNNNIKLTFSEDVILPDSGQTSLDIINAAGQKLPATEYTVGRGANNKELILTLVDTKLLKEKTSIQTTSSATIKDEFSNTIKAGITKTIN